MLKEDLLGKSDVLDLVSFVWSINDICPHMFGIYPTLLKYISQSGFGLIKFEDESFGRKTLSYNVRKENSA